MHGIANRARRLLPGAALIALAQSLAGCAPESALDADPDAPAELSGSELRCRAPDVVAYEAPSLYPEGVTWDPTRGAFLAASAIDGSVSIVTLDGSVTRLAEGTAPSFGMQVDVERGRLLVAYGNAAAGAAPEDLVSGLAIYDLETGANLHRVDLWLGEGAHFANDVAMDPRGNAYVTDTFAGIIYRVDVRGVVTRTITSPLWETEGLSVNGIVWHPRGYLLTARYDSGQLFRVSPRGEVREVPIDTPAVGVDGMRLRRDGTLLMVTNSLLAPGTEAVSVLEPRRNWESARRVSMTPWPDRAPTTMAVTPRGVYVSSSRLDRLIAGDFTIANFTLRRFESLEPDAAEGARME